MWLWPHFSHALTCPPSAAVRQASIADITRNWPKLRCPACARRYAGPAARKISATSSVGRDNSAADQAGGDLSLNTSRSNGPSTSWISFADTRA